MKIERWKSRPKIISEGRKEGSKGLKLPLIPRISITPLSLQLINTRRSNTDRVISDLFLKKIRKKSSVSRVRDQVSKVWRALALGGGRRWTDGWMDGWMDGRMGGGRRINLDMFAEQSNIWVESLAGVIDWFGRWCGESGEQWDGSSEGVETEWERGEIHETSLHRRPRGGGPQRFVRCLLFAVIRGKGGQT